MRSIGAGEADGGDNVFVVLLKGVILRKSEV